VFDLLGVGLDFLGMLLGSCCCFRGLDLDGCFMGLDGSLVGFVYLSCFCLLGGGFDFLVDSIKDLLLLCGCLALSLDGSFGLERGFGVVCNSFHLLFRFVASILNNLLHSF